MANVLEFFDQPNAAASGTVRRTIDEPACCGAFNDNNKPL